MPIKAPKDFALSKSMNLNANLSMRYEVEGMKYEVEGRKYGVEGMKYEVEGMKYEVEGILYLSLMAYGFYEQDTDQKGFYAFFCYK
jgi:hypothetical protein